MTLFSRELHEFRDSLAADIDKLNDRVKDLDTWKNQTMSSSS